MTKIEFDEPSRGNVIVGSPALKINSKRNGIILESEQGYGLVSNVTGQVEPPRSPAGVSASGPIGVIGRSTRPSAAGVIGQGNVGVFGEGVGLAPQGFTRIGIKGRGPIAGRFEGDVQVTGDIKLLNPQNADCAEDFDILEENVEPGTVMVLTVNGSLQPSCQEYDKKVAGIISGAGGYSPAIILGKEEKSDDQRKKNKCRLPVALVGKVYCKVDARPSPIETGDLLTTSSTKGYAMKAEDPIRAFGAVIGKALGSINDGMGMIPVLVTLQ